MVLQGSCLLNRSTLAPVGLAGLGSHLFWTEPANLLLVRLLGSGCFHRLLSSCSGSVSAQEGLLLVLCHLFERVPVHPSMKRAVEEDPGATPSMVRTVRTCEAKKRVGKME